MLLEFGRWDDTAIAATQSKSVKWLRIQDSLPIRTLPRRGNPRFCSLYEVAVFSNLRPRNRDGRAPPRIFLAGRWVPRPILTPRGIHHSYLTVPAQLRLCAEALPCCLITPCLHMKCFFVHILTDCCHQTGCNSITRRLHSKVYDRNIRRGMNCLV